LTERVAAIDSACHGTASNVTFSAFQVRFRALIAAALAGVFASCAHATDYNEFTTGDLSNNPQAPTPLALTPGSNLLVAQSSNQDIDLLRVTVPTSHTLDSITVQFHDSVNVVFAGIESGNLWTAGTGFNIDPSQMLGWVEFPTDIHTSHTGEDILDDMGFAAGSQGFAPSLASGVYTFLFQTSTSAVPFAISFDVSSPVTTLPGDFNGDSVVNGADLSMWRGSYGLNASADANGDGRSDGFDALVWQRNQGLSAVLPAARAVPEPSALIMAVGSLAAMGLVVRRFLAHRTSHRRG
jgi:hypothetical protein